MKEKTRVGIIICDRYRTCAGGKCFRSLRNKEGAFARYKNREAEVVGYTTCAGCPGGNVEYTSAVPGISTFVGSMGFDESVFKRQSTPLPRIEARQKGDQVQWQMKPKKR